MPLFDLLAALVHSLPAQRFQVVGLLSHAALSHSYVRCSGLVLNVP